MQEQLELHQHRRQAVVAICVQSKNLTSFFNENVPPSFTSKGNFNEISSSIITRFLLCPIAGCISEEQNIGDQLHQAVILSMEGPQVKIQDVNMTGSSFRTEVVFLKVSVAKQFNLLEEGGARILFTCHYVNDLEQEMKMSKSNKPMVVVEDTAQ